MDFFGRQDAARRRTRALIAAFAVAVVGLVCASNLVVAVVLPFIPILDQGDVPLAAHLAVTLGTLGVIGVGSATKIAQLAAGGGAGVAEGLGGRLIAPASRDAADRRLLDVVEEMALASGVPVPPVYVLPGEDLINAFAAGFGPGDAVIGVTRGAALALDRDELQGVVAHEFSHLLNGDTRLDLRMIGVLHGILAIGQLGQELLSAGGGDGDDEPQRSSWWADDAVPGTGPRRGSGAGPLWIVGAALMVFGALGTAVGELIRAGISRSREYLADAAAVQFTRQPRGVAGALKKVGGTGSAVVERGALEARHVFFATAVGGGVLDGLLATHPRLDDRIRAIEPGWDGRYLVAPRPVEHADAPAAPDRAAAALARIAAAATVGTARAGFTALAAAASARAGAVTGDAVRAGGALLGALPAELTAAARDAGSARAVVCALVLDPDAAMAERQLAALRDRDAATADAVVGLRAAVATAGDSARLALLDLCAPALRALSPVQRDGFANALRALIACDGRTTLDEWLIARLALGRLDAGMPGARDALSLWPSAAVVIAALARAGAADDAGAEAAYAAARAVLRELPTQPPAPERCTPERLDAALARLADTVATFKRRLVDATAACIDADGTRTAREVELERVVCASLGVPMPMA